ncbi:MAG: glutamate racemase [Hyphomicrobiales bacterium]|nr:glutamate racemase [Hyphomicrobiales bacterium]
MNQGVGGHILVIDSGIGGLGVLSHVQKYLPNVDYSYVADEAFFPYGRLSKQTLEHRAAQIVAAIDRANNLDCVVVACNTASTVVLEHLRAKFNVPIIGIVPAIKVAAKLTRTKAIGILATEATAKGEYIKTLVEKFANDCVVKLHGAKNLAHLAEQKLNGKKLSIADVAREIAPLFSAMRFKEQKHIDQVVLGCTHYPFLLDELKQAAPYVVNWVDPAEAVANQVVKLFKPHQTTNIVSRSTYYTTAQKSGYKVKNIGFQFLQL